MFKYLTQVPDIDTQVYYYDPGLLTKRLDPGFGVSEAWDVDLLSGTHSKVLPSWFRGREINAYRQLNPSIVKVLTRERFDAIFVTGYTSPSSWLVVFAAKLFGARVLYQSDTNILDERRRKRSRMKRALRGLFLRQVNTFLVIGNKNREAYLNLGCDPERMIWCPYPVDAARFKTARNDPHLKEKLTELRRQHEIPAQAQIVAFCGKLLPRKRPRDLIDALRLLRRKEVCGLLIGSGPLEQSLRDYLTSQDNIRITGFVNQQMIPYYMLLADTGVVLSDWDPHPLVTTEFAMCGLPVVVSDLCGVWGDDDILRIGENGFVYPCGDTVKLAERLAAILDDEPLRMRMGRRALELSEKQSAEYAAEVIAQDLRRTFNGQPSARLAG